MTSANPSNQLVAKLQEYSVPLLSGVVCALVWANVDIEGYHHFIHASPLGDGSHLNLHFLVNDILMALFFGIAAKEITEACLPGGALNPVRKAVNPLMATAGGILGPAGVYFACTLITGDQAIANGWAIPTATDIALAWLVARLAFGASHPAVSFLLLLAVADDGIGLGIIAIFYPDPLKPVLPQFIGLVALAMFIAYLLRRRNVRSYWAYLLVPGVCSWVGFLKAHLHPALALVPIIPFLPHAGKDEGIFAESGGHHDDTLNRFEHAFKMPVDFGLFAFGLANAGVQFADVGTATYAVLLALVFGKTIGIFGCSTIAARLGFPLPAGMTSGDLVLTAATAGLGLTVALFVADVAFTEASLQGAAKMGALLSAGIAPVVLILARMQRRRSTDVVTQRAAVG